MDPGVIHTSWLSTKVPMLDRSSGGFATAFPPPINGTQAGLGTTQIDLDPLARLPHGYGLRRVLILAESPAPKVTYRVPYGTKWIANRKVGLGPPLSPPPPNRAPLRRVAFSPSRPLRFNRFR